ncbi:hypothetical protein Pyn_35882 [Prunus yedoensis var. nudiflora]|uniref:Uncharacterized protein n=1 Tax=Prunus yedoensis var. nudiflora TaxID=2094558 RepID=A0A314V1I3_PRUYE|nr:hypothetical protein Pyn_35882 [Prunus yedoensis var. nudiflora]
MVPCMRRIQEFSRAVPFGGISELKIGGFGQLSVLLHTPPTGQLGAGNYQWTEDPHCCSARVEGKNSYFFPRCSCGYQEKVSAGRSWEWCEGQGSAQSSLQQAGQSSGFSSPLVVPPSSTVLSSAGSEGRIAEAGSSAERAGPVPEVEEAQGRSTSEVDNRTKVASTPLIPTETLGPEKEVAEDAAPMAKSPVAETPAEKNDQGGYAPYDDAPRAQENAPKIPATTPAVDPSSASAKGEDSAREMVALPLADKVADEQGVKVSNALDSICRASPDFATFCETAKTDLEALVRKVKCDDPLLHTPEVLPGLEAELAQAKKVMEAQHQELNDQDALLKQVCWRLKTAEARLARVQVQKRELQDAADQMLSMLSLAKEDLDKADLDVGLDLWNEKLKKIRIDRLRVDVLHFSDKIKTLLDLLV